MPLYEKYERRQRMMLKLLAELQQALERVDTIREAMRRLTVHADVMDREPGLETLAKAYKRAHEAQKEREAEYERQYAERAEEEFERTYDGLD